MTDRKWHNCDGSWYDCDYRWYNCDCTWYNCDCSWYDGDYKFYLCRRSWFDCDRYVFSEINNSNITENLHAKRWVEVVVISPVDFNVAGLLVLDSEIIYP